MGVYLIRCLEEYFFYIILKFQKTIWIGCNSIEVQILSAFNNKQENFIFWGRMSREIINNWVIFYNLVLLNDSKYYIKIFHIFSQTRHTEKGMKNGPFGHLKTHFCRSTPTSPVKIRSRSSLELLCNILTSSSLSNFIKLFPLVQKLKN